jgi:hypothetical protein
MLRVGGTAGLMAYNLLYYWRSVFAALGHCCCSLSLKGRGLLFILFSCCENLLLYFFFFVLFCAELDIGFLHVVGLISCTSLNWSPTLRWIDFSHISGFISAYQVTWFNISQSLSLGDEDIQRRERGKEERQEETTNHVRTSSADIFFFYSS